MKFKKNVLWSVCAVVLATQIFVVNNVSAYSSCNSVSDIFLKGLFSFLSQSVRHVEENTAIKGAKGSGIIGTDFYLDSKYSSVENRVLNAKGHETEISAFASLKFSESLSLGLGYSHNRYDVSSKFFDAENNTQTMDLVLSYRLENGLSISSFVNFSTIDVEENAWWMQDTVDRWGMGLAVAYTYNVNEKLALDYIGMLSSFNKSSIARAFDNEDSSFVNMLRATYNMNDTISVSVYGMSVTALDREDNRPDGCYFVYGTDVNFGFTANMGLVIGYETTAADEDNNRNSLTASMKVSF